jgi:hypothetical protein
MNNFLEKRALRIISTHTKLSFAYVSEINKAKQTYNVSQTSTGSLNTTIK